MLRSSSFFGGVSGSGETGLVPHALEPLWRVFSQSEGSTTACSPPMSESRSVANDLYGPVLRDVMVFWVVVRALV